MNKEIYRHLSKRDLCGILDLTYQTLNCADYDGFKKNVLDFKNIFSFESAVCAYGNIETALSQKVPEINLLDISYPRGYLDLYFEKQYHKTDAEIYEFLANLKPVNWNKVECGSGYTYPASVTAMDFGMKDGWTYGILDIDSMNCSTFFFGNPSCVDGHVRTEKILEYIIPFLSEAYKKLLIKEYSPDVKLTPREIEVINWVKEGKSSWEISLILHCSKRAVDFHVTNIKRKLSAVSRTQAVAIALHKGIIKF
jgi:DNA-binding CsgD family transcriptional regulator